MKGNYTSRFATVVRNARGAAANGLLLAHLAVSQPLLAQDPVPVPLTDAEKAVMDALMAPAGSLPGNMPNAGLTNEPVGAGALARMEDLKQHLGAAIAQHGEQSPQATQARRSLADQQDYVANQFFAAGFYRDAFPLFVQVREERERRKGIDSAESAASRGNMEKTLEKLKLQGPVIK